MRALFSSARPQRFAVFAAAFAAVAIASCGASVAFTAGTASAATTPSPSASAPAAACTTTPNIDYVWDNAHTFTASLMDGIAPCSDVTVNITSYNVPQSWDGLGWDASAAPQTMYKTDTLTFPANTTAPVTKSVQAPTCGNYQADLYPGAVQNTVNYPDGTIGWIAGNLVNQAQCAPGDVTDVALFTDASCASSADSYSITAATGVDFFVKVGNGPTNPATADGSQVPATAGQTVVITAAPEAGYGALTGYPTGGWTHTFPGTVTGCAVTPTPPTTPPIVHVTTVPTTPTGSIAETCPTTNTDESYTVTMTNPAGSATVTASPMLFQLSVNGGVLVTSPSIAAGASFTYPGTLPAGTAATITASFQAAGTTTWTPVVIAGTQATFPCPAVLGEQIVKPTTAQPVVTVKPVVVKPVIVKPVATLPFTGLPTLPTALVGVGLVGAGFGLVLISRRKGTQF
jgi:hypothetical protein